MVAPSLIPMKAGDRVKTDRRDALMLARLHRAGELTPIWIPDAAHEAMRDLVRARATAVRALSKARQHLQGFLLRHDQICHGARAWTLAYRLVAEVGDFRRFTNARLLMAYLGLVPSEHSSGSTVRRAGITKAGNALARRVLIEGAWTYRMSARVSRKLHDRLEPLSAAIRDIAWKAQVRPAGSPRCTLIIRRSRSCCRTKSILSRDAECRRDRLTRQIEELMPTWSMASVAAALQAMRGVALVVAVTVLRTGC